MQTLDESRKRSWSGNGWDEEDEEMMITEQQDEGQRGGEGGEYVKQAGLGEGPAMTERMVPQGSKSQFVSLVHQAK